jgi:predicted metal-dependent phosphoesterase TrpH
MPPSTPICFDMHLHTSRHSEDGEINPFALLRYAERLGLTGVVITEHDYLWTEAELEELRAATPGILVFAGVEVSAHEGHFLAYGVTNPLRLPKGIKVKELCDEVHRQGGAVVAAHPFRWGQKFDEIVKESRPALDGMELMSMNMDGAVRRQAHEFWQQHPWSGVGNSDAHELKQVGMCYTQFPQPIRDQRDLVEALRAGKGMAQERNVVQIHALLDDDD